MDFLNLKNGKIIYNDFNINFNKPFNEQLYMLKEDLLQIEYGKDYLLDIGWYPEFNLKGNFIAYLIKNYDWNNIVYKQDFRTEKQLKQIINEVNNIIYKI